MNNKEVFTQICSETLKREGSKELLAWLEKSDYFIAPASTMYHGVEEGGLLTHSLNVYSRLCKLIRENQIEQSPETIAISALFHDICKVNFYKKGTRNVKNEETGQWEKVLRYEYDDQLPLGHGEKSVIMLQNFMRLTIDEIYAIRWHMGGYDCAVKGGERAISSAYEKCPLAVMLHLADMEATYLDEKR